MNFKNVFTLGLCVLLGLGVFAQPGKKGESKIDLNKEIKLESTVRYGKLENGMTYYIKANKMPENRAEFQLAVNAGSVLEEEDQRGLAHFTEHMGFNGTKQFPGNELTSELQKNGITFGKDDNAYTAFDQTVYTLTLPTDKPELFNLGLKVLDGWSSGMLMAAGEIDAERGVITEEWRLGQGASDRMNQKTWPIIFKGSKYAERLPIGTYDNLQNFKYSSIRNYYQKWYRPDNQALIIVGDFDADEMEQKVKDYFSMTRCPETPLQRPEFSIPDNDEPLVAVATDKEATSTSLNVIYKHPTKPMKTIGDFRNQELMINLYETMLADRLNEIGEKKGCPYMAAQSGYMTSFIARNVGGYYIGGVSKEGKVMDMLNLLLQENKRVYDHGFLQTELDRAKENLLEQYERASKSANKTYSSTYASQFVNNFLEQTPAPGARWEYRTAKALIEGITLEEINALAKQWINDKNIIAFINMPEKKGVKVPTAEQVTKALKSFNSIKTKPYVDTYKEMPFLASEPKAGKIVSRTTDKDFGYTTLKLSNGATVILKPSTIKDNEILFSAWSKGGSSLYPDKDMINVQFAADMVDACGIGNFDAPALQKYLAKHPLGLSPSINGLTESLSGSCQPKDLETLLQYNYMFFTSPRKDADVLANKKESLKTQLSAVANSPEVAFSLALNKAMYPTDKRTIALPTVKQIDEMNMDKMYKIFRERFAGANDFTFQLVGNFAIDTIEPLLEKYIGGIPGNNPAENYKDVSAPFAKGVVDQKVYKGTDDKAMLVLATNKAYEYGDKLNRTMDVIGEVLTIRATEVIREQLGATYSPYLGSSYTNIPKSEFKVMGYYTCSPDNVEKVQQATFEIMDEMAKNGISEENLKKAKEQLINGVESSYTSSNEYWAGQIKSKVLWNEQIKNLETIKAEINAVTLDDVKAAAAKYLTHSEYVKVTLLPETKKETKK